MLSNLRSWIIGFLGLFKKPITVKYRSDNEERIPLYDRLRGELILNLPNCRGCGFCVDACPNESLKMIDYDNGNPKNKDKKVPQHNLAMCTYCDLCVDACPFDTLKAGLVYDSAFYDVEEMIRSPEQLYEAWKEQRGKNEEEEENIKEEEK